MIDRDAKVFITGHRGMVGSALVRRFKKAGFQSILVATRHEVDLRDQHQVDAWFAENKPDYVVHAAGTVGGINANQTRSAEFLYDNLMIGATVIQSAWQHQVTKLLYLGSSCIYPRDCPQPIREEYLMTGPLEVTNDGYAIAKIAGLKACEAFRRQHGCNFISAMPTNLYGPNDNFDLKNSHVLPALIRKFHDCKLAGGGKVTLWGTGSPKREFLHVDELSDACLFLLENYEEAETINVGTGQDLSIADLADAVRQIVCPEAEIEYDTSMPDGTPRKLLDVTRLNELGWESRTPLSEGLSSTYTWFLENVEKPASVRGVAAS